MLTPRQKQLKDYINKIISKKGIAPTEREIARRFKISPSTTHEHLTTLQQKGYLEKAHGRARGIQIPDSVSNLVKIPLLGTIAAGEPIEAIRQHEFISVPKNKLPKGGQVYALRVAGNSMIDENIKDGDVVLVKQQDVAEKKQRKTIIDAEDYKIRLSRLKKRVERIEIFLPALYIKEKCQICHQKQDVYGRCSCVNKDAW